MPRQYRLHIEREYDKRRLCWCYALVLCSKDGRSHEYNFIVNDVLFDQSLFDETVNEFIVNGVKTLMDDGFIPESPDNIKIWYRKDEHDKLESNEGAGDLPEGGAGSGSGYYTRVARP